MNSYLRFMPALKSLERESMRGTSLERLQGILVCQEIEKRLRNGVETKDDVTLLTMEMRILGFKMEGGIHD